MSLHYLVKLEMLTQQVLPMSCYRHWVVTERNSSIPPQLWPPNSPDL